MGGAPVVIDVIDNGGQWTHREWRMLRYLGVDTQILPNDVPVSEMRELDGLILAGLAFGDHSEAWWRRSYLIIMALPNRLVRWCALE